MSDPHDPLRSAQRRRMPTGVIARTRLVVGIDLGTTNTALAWVDRQSGRLARAVRSFDLPQLTDPGVVRPLRTLPSAAYVRGPHELTGAQVALPWDPEGAAPLVCGQLARQRGALTPDRLITSAKSWLCHPGVDRKAAILPWGAPDEVQKVSPIAVEAALLRHVRDAWNHAQARDDDKKRLERADVVVTLPASFDEVARELTVQAVHEAGLEDAVLIEEPTAALYAWIAAHEAEWPEVLAPGQTILVCDVGGGTTDLSLIRVTDYRPPAVAGADDEVEPPGFERVAVGEHLLLGGDNMDHALARRVEERLGKKLDLREWTGLVIACRDAKEKLLEGQAESAPIVVTGRGARLIGGTLRTDLGRAEVLEAVLEGFFPRVTADEPLPRRKVGLKELGLPYEPDPAVTRHLRRFLARHAPPGAPLARVDHVLFNGGVFKTAALRERVLDVLASWQERPRELEGSDLDLAVAHGAAYYGLVRRGKGTRIKSGAGRAYYLEVRAGGGERTAMCLIPRGLEEGGVVTISDHPLEVRANTPVVFPFHTATGRDDAAGALLPVDPEQLEELAPLHTIIRAGKRATGRERTIPVELVARYTELGTLEIWLQEKGADRRWRLELDTRPRDDASGEGRPRGGPPAAGRRVGAWPVDELPPTLRGGRARSRPERVDRARSTPSRASGSRPAGARPQGLGKGSGGLGGPHETWPVPVIRAPCSTPSSRTRPPAAALPRTRPLAGTWSASACGPASAPRSTSTAWAAY
ncbi:MAG: Hsp70 family protein [Planctomycetota bacterium]|nr:Hsp70 family protein [Planctomycetota bacterium]